MLKCPFQIDHIYLDLEIQKSPLAQKILRAFKAIPCTIISNEKEFLQKITDTPLSQGKKNLWLTRFKGPFLKPCPATGPDYLCCQYWTLNVQTHCPLDCTYCILQNFLNVPVIKIYTNIENITKEISALLGSEPRRLFRMGTGELTDSLALDPVTRFNQKLIRYALKKNMVLEIKTKTDFVDHLPKIEKRNILVSWSLNPDVFIKSEEFKSVSLTRRLKAASCVLQKGYRLGFHLDPLLLLPGWEKHYTKMLRELTSRIPESEVMWISLGSLRFPPSLKKTIEARFPKTRITTAELGKGLDGKMRYFRQDREKIYQRVYDEIRNKWKDVFVYFCMENQTVWKNVTGFAPENNGHLDFLFHLSIAQRFPDLKLPKADRIIYQKSHERLTLNRRSVLTA